MTHFVLDASITLSWCFSDKTTSSTTKLLERLVKEKAYVPMIWTLEVGNILMGAERKKRITYAKISEFLSLLAHINIEIDTETTSRAFHEIIMLAHTEHLTTYDAAYLELAIRKGIPLATQDLHLKKAATRLGVETLS